MRSGIACTVFVAAVALSACGSKPTTPPVQPLTCSKVDCPSLPISVADNCNFGNKDDIPEISLSGGPGKRTLTWTIAPGSPYVFAPEKNFTKGPIYFPGDARLVVNDRSRVGDPRDRIDPSDVQVKDAGKTLELKFDRQRGEIEITDPIRIKYVLNLVHETRKYKDRNGKETTAEWCEIDPWIVDR